MKQKIEGLKVQRSRIVSELGEDIGVTKQKQKTKKKTKIMKRYVK